MLMKKLSKSDYISGLQCPLALWLKYNRKDLTPEPTESMKTRFEEGEEVGEYGRRYFGKGILIDAPYHELGKAIKETLGAVSNGESIIFEAAAQAPDGSYSRIDILRKDPDSGRWDMIEVKSGTEIKDYYYDDIAFQYYVFSNAGYDIKDCYLMTVNSSYVRNGEIDPHGLLTINHVTDKLHSILPNVKGIASGLMSVIDSKNPPNESIGARCDSPHECGCKAECFKPVPEYSVFDLFDKNKIDEIYEKYGAKIETLPKNAWPKGKGKVIGIESYLGNKEHINKEALRGFLDSLQYPLYFLDYETVKSAVPLFDGTSPHQQIPFQFSLHILREPGLELEHVEFLHESISDPRYELVDKLVESIGSKGSVIVYNETFEKTRNKELAEYFPSYKARLNNINERVVDLYKPFNKRDIYNPKQNGSASIKHTLPAFTCMTYEGMDISNGGEASAGYLKYLRGELSGEEERRLFEGLKKYCEQDTLAMVELLRVIEIKSR